MTNTNKSFLPAILFLVAIIIICATASDVRRAGASAPSGLQATVATSSNPTVSATVTGVIVASTTNSGQGCAARIITTGANPIMLTFSDNQGKIPTATYGHYQGASTTVAYDGGIYGCGAFRAYSFGSQSISVTETR